MPNLKETYSISKFQEIVKYFELNNQKVLIVDENKNIINFSSSIKELIDVNSLIGKNLFSFIRIMESDSSLNLLEGIKNPISLKASIKNINTNNKCKIDVLPLDEDKLILTIRKNNDDIISCEELGSLIECSESNFIFVIDEKGIVRQKSNNWKYIIGNEVILNKPITDFIHKDDRERFYENVESIFKGDNLFSKIDIRVKHESDWHWHRTSIKKTELEGQNLIIGISSDIQLSKEYERVTEQSRRKYKLLFETSRYPILLIENNQFVNCNKATLELLGYDSIDDIKGRSPFELSPKYQPDGSLSSEKAIKMINKAIEIGTYTFNWCHLKKDNTEVFVEVTLNVIDDNGTTRIYTFWKDVTQDRIFRSELENSRRFLHNVINLIPNMIFVKDSNGRYELVNKAFADFYGTEIENILGKTDKQFGFLKSLDKIESEDKYITERNEKHERDHEVTNYCGETKILRIIKMPLRMSFHNEKKLLGIAIDQTKQKRIETEIRKNAALTHSTLESTIDGILVTDRHNKIIEYNSNFINLWKIPSDIEEQSKKEKIYSLMYKSIRDPKRFIKKSQQLKDDPKSEYHDYIEFLDGRVFELFSKPLISDNLFFGRVWNFRDITDQILQEEEIKRYIEELQETKDMTEKNAFEIVKMNLMLEESEKKLQELNASKDKFFSIIAHDLKSPFTALFGIGDLLSEGLEDISPEERIELVDSLNNTVKNVYKLLENLLDWSRIQTGRMSYDPEHFDFYELVETVVSLLNSVADQKDIKIENLVQNNLSVFADWKMCDTVIRNLVSNALKFTPKDGFVKIKSKRLDDNFVEIGIQDNGIGISEEDKEKLFKIDVHHTTAGTNNEKGTGLGLILCRELIEQNGGEIYVESEYNRGTTFYMKLPLKAME